MADERARARAMQLRALAMRQQAQSSGPQHVPQPRAFADEAPATAGGFWLEPQRSPQPEIPEGFVLDPKTGQYTTREWMAQNIQPSRAGAAVAGGAHGFTLGGVDEALGAIGSLTGQGDFQRERARARLDAARRDYPGTTMASEVAGAMAVPMAGAGAMQGASRATQVAAGAGAGAGFGAQYGFLSGEGGAGERAQSAATGAAIGGLAGAAVPAVVGGIRGVINHAKSTRAMNEAAKTAPTTEGLRQQASALYEAAKQRGITLRGDSFKSFAEDLSRLVRVEGADPSITPAAFGVVRRLEALGRGAQKRPVAFRDLDTLRKMATKASTSNNPPDRMIAGMVLEGVDDYVARLVDGDLVSGAARGVSRELTEARTLWRSMRNSEVIEKAVERARDQASGFENGIRIQFRQLLGNQKFARSLSDGEREAMRAVVRGTPIGNTLKRLSRMGFGTGAQTNFMGASLVSGMGAAAGSAFGPVGAAAGAIVPGVVGHLAGRGAQASTVALANRARAVAAGGGLSLPAPPALNALRSTGERAMQGVLPLSDALRR